MSSFYFKCHYVVRRYAEYLHVECCGATIATIMKNYLISRLSVFVMAGGKILMRANISQI